MSSNCGEWRMDKFSSSGKEIEEKVKKMRMVFLDVGVSHYIPRFEKILNEDSKKSLFCILRKQILQNCWFEKTKQNENEDSKKSLFFSSSLNSHPVTKKLKKKSKKLRMDKYDTEEKVKKIENGQIRYPTLV